jgi:DNA-binding response OmpR family regulator
MERIGERKKNEALLELAIVSNPHTQKPELLFNELKDHGSYNPDDKLDRVAMDKLRGKLKKSNLIKVKDG